jgi:hypothetical protein
VPAMFASRVCLLIISAGWMVHVLRIFLVFVIGDFQRLSSDVDRDLDCFFDLGAYKICYSTQRLSIFSSLLLLMTQALLSRMFLPGISNFINASVRRLHPRACCGTS